MHMISKKDLNSVEMDTLTTSRSPTTVITANGEVLGLSTSSQACALQHPWHLGDMKLIILRLFQARLPHQPWHLQLCQATVWLDKHGGPVWDRFLSRNWARTRWPKELQILHFKHHRYSTRRRPERAQRVEFQAGRGEKARNFGLPPFWASTIWPSTFIGFSHPLLLSLLLLFAAFFCCFCCCRCFGVADRWTSPLPLLTFQNVSNNFTIDQLPLTSQKKSITHFFTNFTEFQAGERKKREILGGHPSGPSLFVGLAPPLSGLLLLLLLCWFCCFSVVCAVAADFVVCYCLCCNCFCCFCCCFSCCFCCCFWCFLPCAAFLLFVLLFLLFLLLRSTAFTAAFAAAFGPPTVEPTLAAFLTFQNVCTASAAFCSAFATNCCCLLLLFLLFVLLLLLFVFLLLLLLRFAVVPGAAFAVAVACICCSCFNCCLCSFFAYLCCFSCCLCYCLCSCCCFLLPLFVLLLLLLLLLLLDRRPLNPHPCRFWLSKMFVLLLLLFVLLFVTCCCWLFVLLFAAGCAAFAAAFGRRPLNNPPLPLVPF